MRMHYAGQAGEGYGWGVCNKNLRLELSRMCDLTGSDIDSRDVVFMPLADHDFRAATQARGKVNLAYSFFEYPLGPNAASNAAKYDTVFVGSTWCKERCAERGIHNTQVLIQGVDSDIYKPSPPRAPDGKFRIFSGGKFEYRKGQALVIAAFREFAKTHPDAHLVCSWWNPWPHLINKAIALWDNIYLPNGGFDSQELFFSETLEANGIHKSQFTILPRLSQRDLAREMANTDCGIFPNRCEGGTNLVLMEYLSTGRHAIANRRTGHADLGEAIRYEITSGDDENHWANQSIESIVEAMKRAYSKRGKVTSGEPTKWSWRAAAEKIVAEAERCLYQKQREPTNSSMV